MAVMTYTKRQVVADLFPEFLSRRGQAFAPVAEAFARELGVPRTALGFAGSLALLEDGALRRERSRWRSPYAMRLPAVEEQWAESVRAGFAEAVADGWRVTPRGHEIADEFQRRFRAALRSAPLPPAPTSTATRDLSRLASRIPATAERAQLVKRLPHAPAAEPASPAVTLNRAITELWSFRDDSHIAAWRAAGYEGPALDILTQVWSGTDDLTWATQGGVRSVDELAKALGTKQERADMERNVDALVARGDLIRREADLRITPQGQRARDAIEEDTDRRYFAIWDLDDAATARLGDDLRSIIDALPKG